MLYAPLCNGKVPGILFNANELSVRSNLSHIYAIIAIRFIKQMGLFMDEVEVVRLYVTEKLTLRQIAVKFGTDHHRIKRILVRNNIEITTKGRKRVFTDEHRAKISAATKGRTTWSDGKKMTEAFCRKNMKGRLGTAIDLGKYESYERLKFLTGVTSRHRKHFGHSDIVREAFLDRFYFDAAFNAIYDKWIESGKNKWLYPSIDHIDPKANGGGFELDNIRFITWFENRAKADMTLIEWDAFKLATGTASSLFIESILV